MDSGTLAADNLREKHRWGDGNKVYTRKFRNKKALPTTNNINKTQALGIELANSSQNHLSNLRVDGASDNSSTQNLAPPTENGAVKQVVTRVDDRVKINLAAATSKNEVGELRKNLISELDQVRVLVKKLEAKELQLTAAANDVMVERSLVRNNSDMHSVSDVIDGRGFVRMNSDVHSASEVIQRRALVRVNSEMGSRPFRQLTVSVTENNHGMGEYVEKEKRTPKVNQYYRNSDFLLGKDRLPHESNKKHKSNGGKKHGGRGDMELFDRYRNRAFKSCDSLLQRLMKHKHGWVFNEPVNAKALGLHDYHDIIQHPMDLGTVKSRLAQNFYKSPREFAEDVRLTFRNAMTYNPEGQDVHVMAEQLLNVFEERWAIIEVEFNPDWRFEMINDAGLTTPTSRKLPQMRTFNRSESMTKPSNLGPVSRTPVPKKPKAKDPNKRDMTYEEKQRLSTNLQSLPSEKLDNIVQIIKKCNSALCQHDDEIEVDIDSVNAETLWELDRFVTNYKKSLSKTKRKAEIAQARAKDAQAIAAMNPAPPPNPEPAPKENKTDEKNGAAASPIQGEKQGDNVSRSSTSSSSSSDSGSSSSDSDSDSSSADGSDAGQSPRT